jgi:hypothetical protein
MQLQPLTFRPLPLGSIRPEGWLARQLRIQADGISGHLDEFWPDVKDSRWFGGTAEGWERAPYWLDGLVPLAFVTGDPALIEKAHRYVDYIITHQQDDGWLGPREMTMAEGQTVLPSYDIWSLSLALKVLMQYEEATGDQTAGEAALKCLRLVERHIETSPLFNWGQFRWFEALLALYPLYERRGESWLPDLAVKLQAQGFDWRAFFARWPLTAPTTRGHWTYMGHVVNNAMAIKAPGLWWRLTGDDGDRAAVFDLIAKLDRFHGMATGIFSGDECLAGRRPTQGTELCAVVEYAFSLEVLLSVLGDPAFGDRLEQIIFNALPATFSPDMWAHQYDQQANQVEVSIHPREWVSNRPDANLFGVDPDYGCCTANLSQGWPKFAAHLWMATPDGGLAAVAYAPSSARFTADGAPVTVDLSTDYPFDSTLRFTVSAGRPAAFPLLLRIPAWATGAAVRIGAAAPVPAQPGTFHRIERAWQGSTEVVLELPMAPALRRGDNGSVSISRGPLVYALKIGEDWRRVRADAPYRELPHADWEIYPTTPWNYALAVDETSLAQDVRFSAGPVGKRPFSPDGAPVRAIVRGRRLPGWGMANGSAADVPPGPVTSSEPLEELTLIPYGCTNLRITEFPALARE